jgi:hypothetical protein
MSWLIWSGIVVCYLVTAIIGYSLCRIGTDCSRDEERRDLEKFFSGSGGQE